MTTGVNKPVIIIEVILYKEKQALRVTKDTIFNIIDELFLDVGFLNSVPHHPNVDPEIAKRAKWECNALKYAIKSVIEISGIDKVENIMLDPNVDELAWDAHDKNLKMRREQQLL